MRPPKGNLTKIQNKIFTVLTKASFTRAARGGKNRQLSHAFTYPDCVRQKENTMDCFSHG